MRDAPITLSSAAAARLQALAAHGGAAPKLRVSVKGGGCSGFQYEFELVEAAAPGDLVIEQDGSAALVDDVSVPFLKGSVIDFIDELSGAEFKIRNPNARSSCGCGVSFSI
jgi:iron-sulfur cluster assembly accessory protein